MATRVPESQCHETRVVRDERPRVSGRLLPSPRISEVTECHVGNTRGRLHPPQEHRSRERQGIGGALGVLRREASGTNKEHEARRLLKQREGAAVEGRVVFSRADRVTIVELAEHLKADYKADAASQSIAWRSVSRISSRSSGRARPSPSPTRPSPPTACSARKPARRLRPSTVSSPRSSVCSPSR
jgi:hypothetical protein